MAEPVSGSSVDWRTDPGRAHALDDLLRWHDLVLAADHPIPAPGPGSGERAGDFAIALEAELAVTDLVVQRQAEEIEAMHGALRVLAGGFAPRPVVVAQAALAAVQEVRRAWRESGAPGLAEGGRPVAEVAAERDRYREALERIARSPIPRLAYMADGPAPREIAARTLGEEASR